MFYMHSMCTSIKTTTRYQLPTKEFGILALKPILVCWGPLDFPLYIAYINV